RRAGLDVGRGRGLRRQGHGADGERPPPRRGGGTGDAPAVREGPRRRGASPPGRGDGGPQAAARPRLGPGVARSASAYTDWTVAEREVDRRWPMARPRASGSTVS